MPGTERSTELFLKLKNDVFGKDGSMRGEERRREERGEVRGEREEEEEELLTLLLERSEGLGEAGRGLGLGLEGGGVRAFEGRDIGVLGGQGGARGMGSRGRGSRGASLKAGRSSHGASVHVALLVGI